MGTLGETMAKPSQLRCMINAIAFSPDGTKALAGDAFGIVNVWVHTVAERNIMGVAG